MTTPAEPDPSQAVPEAPVAAAPVANPFVPRYREPWINPAKRGVTALVAAAAAVVLLGGGMALGAAVSGGDGHGRHDERMGPGGMMRQGPLGPGLGGGRMRHRGGFPPPTATPAPPSVPATPPSSSPS